MKNNNMPEKASASSKLTGKKKLSVILFAVLLAAITATTIAYVFTVLNPVKNTFELSKVGVDIVEEFDGETKKNVNLKNTGEIDEFMRACIVINWKNESGDVLGKAVLATEYDVTYNDTDWTLGEDGYWYCNQAIAAGESTPNLIGSDGIKLTEVGLLAQPEGYYFSVDIVAQCIQAHPDDAALDAWGVTAEDGTLIFGGDD